MKLVIALLMPQLAGFIGSMFTLPAVGSWYALLNKPSFSPPNWIFGPLWTVLYLLMGIAWYLVLKKKGPSRLFLIHLGLNSLWSVLFFGLKSPGLAFGEIIVLWLAIILVMRQFYRFSRVAAGLLVPYLAWVSFAAFLNFTVWRLNL